MCTLSVANWSKVSCTHELTGLGDVLYGNADYHVRCGENLVNE